YSDWVEEVDWSVGRVLDTLRELKLDSKPLVIFTSDNGGTPRAVNAPLRGFKGSTWEGGMREPTIAWWPGYIPAGTTCDAITGMMDVLPTFVRLAGGQLPAGCKLDGCDIWPLLSGESKQPVHDVFYYFRGLKLEAVRSGPWKLHLGVAAPAKDKAKAKTSPSEPQLYNLDADIGESKNVAKENPDTVKRLQSLANLMKDDLGLNDIGPGCHALGRVKDPKPLINHDGTIREGFAPR
ncbi:MAG: sulfatase-like hydrolase/transferase, partial [Verrucomicrobia bacterium]|nr:sulfatase-like hydrolase/transferase [Verrucomicrobiota bacterium]